jgi:hypothetical protein
MMFSSSIHQIDDAMRMQSDESQDERDEHQDVSSLANQKLSVSWRGITSNVKN